MQRSGEREEVLGCHGVDDRDHDAREALQRPDVHGIHWHGRLQRLLLATLAGVRGGVQEVVLQHHLDGAKQDGRQGKEQPKGHRAARMPVAQLAPGNHAGSYAGHADANPSELRNFPAHEVSKSCGGHRGERCHDGVQTSAEIDQRSVVEDNGQRKAKSDGQDESGVARCRAHGGGKRLVGLALHQPIHHTDQPDGREVQDSHPSRVVEAERRTRQLLHQQLRGDERADEADRAEGGGRPVRPEYKADRAEQGAHDNHGDQLANALGELAGGGNLQQRDR
mmetsp:Transcript_105607/g.275773  ORF Transcript_105607/g.275773 Transcript_105607/m.275773 type:complete len:280 (+) Transcript_105607:395-1234(+)